MKKEKITKDDFMKAVKKADREIELENNPGFKSVTKIFKSDKVYDRKKVKKIEIEE